MALKQLGWEWRDGAWRPRMVEVKEAYDHAAVLRAKAEGTWEGQRKAKEAAKEARQVAKVRERYK
jgi:hypothetical protein